MKKELIERFKKELGDQYTNESLLEFTSGKEFYSCITNEKMKVICVLCFGDYLHAWLESTVSKEKIIISVKNAQALMRETPFKTAEDAYNYLKDKPIVYEDSEIKFIGNVVSIAWRYGHIEYGDIEEIVLDNGAIISGNALLNLRFANVKDFEACEAADFAFNICIALGVLK